MQTYTFHVSGMHCRACTLMIDHELTELPNIERASADLAKHSVTIAGEFGNKSPAEIAAELSAVLAPRGYSLALERTARERRWHEFTLAIPIALGFAALFVLLQKTGLVNLIGGGTVTYGTAFLIGVVASLSTCMAVVGGLVLSMSATFAKEGDSVRPQILFHAGRIVSFFVLGGIVGVIGSAFALGAWGTFALSLLIGLVMLVMGINLLDVFHGAKRLHVPMPRFLARHALETSKLNHTLTPALVGALTFFLPCGFTQAMQIYTLGTGTFMAGALTMLFFALGTLPVLAALSFTSLSIHSSEGRGVFFKTAGLIVILFALLNIMNSLAAIGLTAPLLNF